MTAIDCSPKHYRVVPSGYCSNLRLHASVMGGFRELGNSVPPRPPRADWRLEHDTPALRPSVNRHLGTV